MRTADRRKDYHHILWYNQIFYVIETTLLFKSKQAKTSIVTNNSHYFTSKMILSTILHGKNLKKYNKHCTLFKWQAQMVRYVNTNNDFILIIYRPLQYFHLFHSAQWCYTAVNILQHLRCKISVGVNYMKMKSKHCFQPSSKVLGQSKPHILINCIYISI